ncbi:MAG: TIGR03557 family F420-dependent LLM class oxidoreductase [Deltaproteobacteria bacterium]|nr:TIGR03557 family F420-dependent LLM class oxidoreductase [Deltaproteobacteria bacterium]
MHRREFMRFAAASALVPIMAAVTDTKLMAKTESSASFVGPQTASGRDSNVATPSILKPMVGFMLAHEQFPVPELVELGVAAEQAGFDLLATSDHLQPWQMNEGHAGEAWVTMAAIGGRTQRVWIGPTVTCPTFRYNPAVVAQAFASLSLLCPGRIFLGIGSGEALNEQAATGTWPKWPERSARLVEAAEIIRRMWSGQQVVHNGRYYQVNAKLYDPPAQPVPLLMAANNGPKAMHRSGQYGDGLITDPETWKKHKTDFEAGARAVGKDPRKLPVLVEQFVVVGDHKDAQAAAELWRFIPRAFKTYFNIRDPQAIQERAGAENPIQEVYGKWPVSTDPDVHVKVIMDLFNSGATIVNIHSGQADQRKVIDFYGKQVLPRVRTQLKQS